MLADGVTWPGLVGRDELRPRFGALLDDLKNSRGAALAVSGQPGVGKSAVLDATRAEARARGLQTLASRGIPSETRMEFAGLNQLLSPLLGEVERSSGAGDGLTAVLGRALSTRHSPHAVADAVAELVAASRHSGAPTLLVVDDLQWVDRSTAQVLDSIATRSADIRVGVLAAYRSGECVDVSAFAPMQMTPLDSDAAAELLDCVHPDLGPRARRRLLAESQGYPSLLIDLPTPLSLAQRQDRAALPFLLPPGRNLRTLIPVERLLLQGLPRALLLTAALDEHCDLNDLAAALGSSVDASDFFEALACVVATGAVQLDDRPPALPRLRFMHPLYRNVVVDDASAGERHAAHAGLARAHSHIVERCVRHVAEAVTAPDEAPAAQLEAMALTLLDRGDAALACDMLEAAGELSVEPSARRRRLASAAYLAIDVTGNLPRATAILSDIRRDDAVGSLPAVVATAKAVLVGDANLVTAHHLLLASLARNTIDYSDLAAEDRLAALYSLFKVCFFASRPGMWTGLVDAVMSVGSAAPTDLRLLVSILADPSRATSEALEELDRTLAGGPATRNPATVERLGLAALFVDRTQLCRRALRDVVADGNAGGAVTSSAHAAAVLAGDSYRTGDWAEAAVLTVDGLKTCARHGLHLPAALLRYGAGLLAASQGRLTEAQDTASELSAWGAPQGMRTFYRFGQHIRALAACGQQDYAAAHRIFRQLAPGAVVPLNAPESLWQILDVVESATRSGQTEFARHYVASLRDVGVARLSPQLSFACEGAEALVAAPDEAGERYDAAVHGPVAGAVPFDLARLQLAYGEFLRRRRAPTHAREQLTSALTRFEILGATPWIHRTVSELAATGTAETGSWTAARTVGGLTPQESKVATLVAAGLTNKQIAERLQLSSRTVAAHLRQVFPKLDITTRAAMHDAIEAHAANRRSL